MTDIEVIAQYTPQQLRETADKLLQKAAERKESGVGGYGGHALMVACLRFCADVMSDIKTPCPDIDNVPSCGSENTPQSQTPQLQSREVK